MSNSFGRRRDALHTCCQSGHTSSLSNLPARSTGLGRDEPIVSPNPSFSCVHTLAGLCGKLSRTTVDDFVLRTSGREHTNSQSASEGSTLGAGLSACPAQHARHAAHL